MQQMNRIRLSRTIALLFLVLLFALGSKAQQTSIYNDPQASYEQALDLYSKAKYGSALVIFDKLADGEKSNIQAGSQYYSALCAIQLFHPDASQRLESFIASYPQNAQTNDAIFELGKVQLNEKDYREALESFSKVDKYELSNEKQNEFFFKQGYAYFKIDDLKKAKDNFALLIEKPNKYIIPANYYYAHIAYSDKNYETALKHFERVAGDELFKDVVNYYIVQIYSMQGRYDELLAKSLPLLSDNMDKKSAEIMRLTADAYFHQKNYTEAIKFYQKYLDTKPTMVSRIDNYSIGISNYQTGNYVQAIKYLQLVATTQDSLSQNAYYHLGDCYIKSNQKRFAYNAFNSAYKIKADPVITEEAIFTYAKLAVELSYNPYNEAVLAIQEYLEKYPASTRRDEAYSYLTDLYMLTNNYKNALISIQQINKRTAKLDGAYQRIAFYRGVELFNEQDFDAAIKLFAQAREMSADNTIRADAAYWMGEAYYRTALWDKALDSYNKFLTTPGASTSPNYNIANYNAGYCSFKKKDYSRAIISFRKFSNSNPRDMKIAGDSYLRMGDCYFMTKEFTQAIDCYQKAIGLKVTDSDYAYYQSGISYGVTGNMEEKIRMMQKLISSVSKSSYTDDALYETGLTYTILNNDSEALNYFQRVVKEHPKSTYVKKSLLKSGLIYFNQNRNEDALEVLKRVAKDYPGTPESKEALASVKSIYIEMNDVDQYVDFTKEVPRADVSRSEQDSLTYIAAENQYLNGNCEKAVDGFTKYITKYPEGAFILNANFYKAECDYRNQKYESALKNYTFILSQERSRFTVNAASRSARINHILKNFAAALDSYIKLEETADQPNLLMDALAGQMQCNYELERYGLAIQSAQKVLALDKLPENLTIEVHFTIARSAYKLQNTDLAIREFTETKKLSKTEMGAEAAYMLALMQFENQKWDDCEKSVFSISENYASYDFWVAKSFILLADVYVKKGNLFQARQTLQSIIDNYEGQDLVLIAREKLNAIGSNN